MTDYPTHYDLISLYIIHYTLYRISLLITLYRANCYSTKSLLLYLTNCIANNLKQYEYVILVLLDVSVAFDTINNI